MRSLLRCILPVAALLLAHCSLFDLEKLLESDPTKTRMEGVWQVVEAYNEDGDDILSAISFPVTAFHLSSDNTVVSTAGPMIMYLVYGENNYTQIASKIDQAFNYASLDFNGGEWFIDPGVVERFTLEMKLEGLPGQKTLTDILGFIGIGGDVLDLVIYHRFMEVEVLFEDGNDSTMTWTFDNKTITEYNTKNSQGRFVLWEGFTARFTPCRFVLKKRLKDIGDLVSDVTN